MEQTFCLSFLFDSTAARCYEKHGCKILIVVRVQLREPKLSRKNIFPIKYLSYAGLICRSFIPLRVNSLDAKVTYRNQSIDLQSKSMDWFLYDGNFWHLMS